MEAFYQVPKRAMRRAVEYDMAADDCDEDLQENDYEHMQTLRHSHVSSPPGRCDFNAAGLMTFLPYLARSKK